ncbi:putative Kinase-like domain-containing protein [Seiridium cardinale]|uniref:Kinase-like domain-containing protein n=1 Tax=Seiridium cardinale TaxID=138064 RepID=A0ABR2Y3C4_9PEZI
MGESTSAAGHTTEIQSLLELDRVKIIGSVLSRSVRDLSDSRLRFVPRNVLVDAISKEIVRDFLQSCPELSRIQQLDLTTLADNLAPPADGCHCGKPRCTGGRIIFVALLAISRENLITSFLEPTQPAICDSNLSALSQENADSSYILPEAFQHLPTYELERFIHFTWQMRSPFVQAFAQQKSTIEDANTILEFESNVSLPWTYLGEERDPMEEAVTRVQRVEIHSAHHDPTLLGGALGLKTFLERRQPRISEENCKHEVLANHRTRPHTRIVPLLAAFKHRGSFHLLLPWAHGGNLGDLFRKYATSPQTARDDQQIAAWYSEDWLLGECEGLADGLAAVHEINNDAHHVLPSAQIHADIKPENILCFASGNGESDPFTLKLADFGEAQEVRASTRDVEAHRVAHTKTYRPPEHDTDDLLTLNYDVWCLGCVYLDFVTWAIGGMKVQEDFEEIRCNERDDAKVDTAEGKIIRDTFFKKGSEHSIRQFRPGLKFGSKTAVRLDPKVSKTVTRERHSMWVEHTGSRVKTVVKDGVISISLDPE